MDGTYGARDRPGRARGIAYTLYTPAAPRAPARDCGKPRSSLERPDPENSRPHTCTEIEYGTAPLPKELYSLARLAHMHT